jgi:hypothetical protein
MKLRKARYIVLAIAVFFLMGTAYAQQSINLKPAQNTVDNIRPADPPQVSTTTKPSQVGQPVSVFKPPAAKSLHVKEVPAPVLVKPAPKK